MAIPDNLHTLLVGWAKIILPMGALALLSTLFLFARSTNDTGDIPFAEIAVLAAEQRITAPKFSGVTDDGSVIAITARNATPDPTNAQALTVESLTLALNAPDGSTLNITSGTSRIDGAAKSAKLEGLARLTTSTGYTMETVGITADLATGVISSDGVLEIQAPFGELTAGRLEVIVGVNGTGRQMLFTDGVRLLYTPSGTIKE